MTSARGNVTKTEVEMDIATTSLHVIGGGTEQVIGGTEKENNTDRLIGMYTVATARHSYDETIHFLYLPKAVTSHHPRGYCNSLKSDATLYVWCMTLLPVIITGISPAVVPEVPNSLPA